jgi:O-antigen chain-terminating methyltransferase
MAEGEDLRLLGMRAVTGRIEAILSWAPDSALRQAAEGTDLHLSSHILDPADGRVILFDGPRTVPCRGKEGRLAVLPLEIPPRPGRYRVQIEPVVEHRFWASDRGYPPLVLDVERNPDSSVLFQDPTANRHYLLTGSVGTFSIDTPLYGLDDSERCIEIPWVLSRYRREARVLDVGYANAEPRYVLARDALKIPLLVGLDPAAIPQSGVSAVAGDALALPFCSGAFDLILAISVIEHIGRDNSIYYQGDRENRESGDLEAAAALASLLRPGGRMLVTVPFGRPEDHGWFVQYDRQRVEALVKATACELTRAEYYADGPDGWTGTLDPASLGRIEYRTGFAARAVACLEFTGPQKRGTRLGRPYRSRPDT